VGISLKHLLRSAKREMRVKGMEGELVADPIAQDILNHPDMDAIIAVIEKGLNEIGISSLQHLSAGSSSIVFDCGDSVLRLGLGPLVGIPDIREVNQRLTGGCIEGVRWEIFPKTATEGITARDVEKMVRVLAEKECLFTDAGVDNLGRLKGRLVVIDPGAVVKTSCFPGRV